MPSHLPPVVDRDWLKQHLDEVVLADVRWYLDGRSGRAAYEAGHLPGAVFVDLDRWLASEPSPERGRHPLPDPEVFARGMSGLGIGDRTTVVAYDDAGGTVAARLVWLLRVTGHEAALLDGGLAAWTGDLTTHDPVRRPATFTPRPWPSERLVDIDDLDDLDAAEPATPADRADPADHVVLDVRAAERYRGEVEPVDPRAGHIPGAVSLPTTGALAEGGRFLPAEDLRRRFEEAGVTDGSQVVAYCGSGVNACHTLLALEHAGLGQGRLFPGSWSQWSSDPARPAAVGPTPG